MPLKKKRIPLMPPVLPCGGRRLSRGLSHPVFLGRFLVSPFSVFDLTLTVLSSFGNLRTHFVVLVQRA